MSGQALAAAVVLGVLAALGAWLLPRPVAVTVALFAVLIAAYLARSGSEAPEGPAETPESGPGERPVDEFAALEGLEEAVIVIDAEEQVLAANEAARRLLDRPHERLVGVSLIRATRQHDLTRVAREARGVAEEVDMGADRVVRVRAWRLPDEPAASAGVAARGRTVLAIQERTALRRAERARSDLVANVSHELRTPLTAALALAETLEEGVPDEEQRARFASQLTAELRRLGRMVDRLLHLSRLESEAEPLQVVALQPAELLATAAERLAPLGQRGQRIEVEAGEAAPVLGDRDRVLEALSNMVENALRFSPDGGTVVLAAVPEGESVRFEVRDSGPGILPSERSRVFERFYTGDRARTSAEGGGSGLGLAIARHIVERLGGRIWVADTERGATVCFTLPEAPAGRRPAEPAPHI